MGLSRRHFYRVMAGTGVSAKVYPQSYLIGIKGLAQGVEINLLCLRVLMWRERPVAERSRWIAWGLTGLVCMAWSALI